MPRPRSLALSLSLLLMACPRPSDPTAPTVDCPPTSSEPSPVHPTLVASASEEPPPAASAREVEALTIEADDGHPLRLWTLAPGQSSASVGSILLLHGRTWSSLPDFDLRVGDGAEADPSLSLMHLLAERGYVTYALDLRGYGQTERDTSGWIEPDRAAADLASALRFIAERDRTTPDVLGWSYGALVAQLAIQRERKLARALILYGYPRDPDARTPKATTRGEPPRSPNTESAARSDFTGTGTISAEAVQAYVDAALAADPIRVDWRSTHQFDALDPSAVGVPTLVIHGVNDSIAEPLWQAKLFTRLEVTDKQWVVVPKARHAAHLEQPERFVTALLAFLAPQAKPAANDHAD